MDNNLSSRAKGFAANIVYVCDQLKINPILINQLLRSGTSIGANIQEAQYAQSRSDFVSKLEIALKECHETEYWLELLNRTGKLDDKYYKKLIRDAGLIRKTLIKSCRTAKDNV